MNDSKKANPLLLDHQFCFSLYATSRAITKTYSALLEKMGLTYPQYLTLMVLWEDNGMSIQQIADKLEIEGATATPLIQRIEKLGLVERKRCNKDHRLCEIHLTKEGANLRDEALNIPPQLGKALGISANYAEQLVSEFKLIRERLG